MKYLNLGCGKTYSTEEVWTNIDFAYSGEGVIVHNLLNGIPYPENTFDLVYTSHVLEHFTKDDGELFVAECFRVLKPGGVLRIVVPDLEAIVRNYIRLLDELLEDPTDQLAKANYMWILLEMYDQTVRTFGGGNMGKYLFKKRIINEDFVIKRFGEEASKIRRSLLNSDFNKIEKTRAVTFPEKLLKIFKHKVKTYLFKKLNTSEKAVSIGNFRLGGEVHQWMYDRYSLSELLSVFGAKQIKVMDGYTSFIENWIIYELDIVENRVRKPDSLFMEAIK